MVGTIILLVAIVLCLLAVVGIDSAVIAPLNATLEVTQTWEANHPGAVSPNAAPTRRAPRPPSAPTPGNLDLPACMSCAAAVN